MPILDSLDWAAVRQHYEDRIGVSNTLIQLYNRKAASQFSELALGITNANGNYSAAEHGLGPKILYPEYNRDAEARVLALAGEFMSLTDARYIQRQAG